MERKTSRKSYSVRRRETMGKTGSPVPYSKGEQEVATKESTMAGHPSMYHVIMLNDDYTPMDFVTGVLETTFHMTPLEARGTMMKIHQEGQALCGTYTHDVAETKVIKVISAAEQYNYPLRCIIRKEPRYAVKKS